MKKTSSKPLPKIQATQSDAAKVLGGQPETDEEARAAGLKSATASSASSPRLVSPKTKPEALDSK